MLILIFKHLFFAIAIIGALNWAIVGLFNFEIFSYFFGAESFLCRIIYIFIGACAVFSAFYAVIDCKCHCDIFEKSCNKKLPLDK